MISNDDIDNLLKLKDESIHKCLLHDLPGSPVERLITNYACCFADEVNDFLRNKQSNNEYIKEHETLLNKALDSLPSYKGPNVFRMDGISPILKENEAIQKLLLKWFKNRIGQTIKFSNFLSTSKEKWDIKGTQYTIVLELQAKNQNSNGKDIKDHIQNKQKAEIEKEVLFKSNVCFEIIDVANDVPLLKEVDCPGGTILFTNSVLAKDSEFKGKGQKIDTQNDEPGFLQ